MDEKVEFTRMRCGELEGFEYKGKLYSINGVEYCLKTKTTRRANQVIMENLKIWMRR